MNRVVVAGAAALAVVSMLGAANAADAPRAMPAKTPSFIAPVYNWNGAYAGINGGGGWGRSDFSSPFASGTFDTSGGMIGGTLGFNYQMNQTVFGLEGDVDWSNLKGSTTCAPGVSCETRNDWLGTARGRIGYAFDRFLPYVTGGLAVGQVKNSATGLGESSSTKAGYTLGGGLEAALSGPWTAKVEYLYVDLGRSSAPLGADADFHTNTVRAGLNYRF